MPTRALLEEEVYVSPAELERLFPFDAETWRRWVLRGRVPGAVKSGARVLIPLSEAKRFALTKNV